MAPTKLPTRTRTWPDWPRADARAQRNLLDALHSGKWAISGLAERNWSYERRFGDAFAQFTGCGYGVPCSSGTAALTIALKALDIGPGDEVIVPGLTWVACASSVVALGAVPILVDVNPKTLCMAPAAVAAALSGRTRAIMVVHLYSSLADLEGVSTLARKHNIPIIEDCSQAHGAVYRDRRIGSYGTIGAFSLQQSKLLTCGEGGICVTDDADLYDRMQQARVDGRGYRRSEEGSRFHELEFRGNRFGQNLCMGEFQASVALAALDLLDEQNAHRQQQFSILKDMMESLDGVHFVETAQSSTKPTFYRLCCRFDEELAKGADLASVAKFMTSDLRLPVERIDRPLSDHPLYRPLSFPGVARRDDEASKFDPSLFSLPNAWAAYSTCIGLPHYCLLGDASDVADIVACLQKVRRQLEEGRFSA